MIKHRKTNDRPRHLQEDDLASVRGGGASPLVIGGGGITPSDDGVISSRN